MNRRNFLLKGAAAGSAALLARSRTGAGPFIIPARVPNPGIIDIGSVRQVFLDDRAIHQANNLSKITGRPDKSPRNPIVVADQPWELEPARDDSSGLILNGRSVIYDEEEKIFKMWYGGCAALNGGTPICYAISRDGYSWEKPALGIYEFKGSRRNNILASWEDPTYFNFFKDPRDPNPQRRYKALGELEGPVANRTGGVAVMFSPDGLNWTQYSGNPVVRHGPDIADNPILFGWDPRRGKYVGYFRPGHPMAGEIYGAGDHRHIRTIGYSESDDFIHWSPTRPMLAPDGHDRVDTQYVQMTAGLDGEYYVGFNAIYQTHEQTWDIFLMSSRDGFHWNWIDRSTPFLGRGEVGSYDAGYMAPNPPIVHDGKIWIYYRAVSGAHSYNPTRRGKRHMTIALCTLPMDRWVGLLAGPNRGALVTRPVIFSGNKLMVDIDASVPLSPPNNPPRFDECQVRVALEDQSGGPIEGFTVDRSTVLVRSGRQEVRWSGAELGRLAGRPVRARFEMRNAALYSWQFS